eukprot:1153453-Pelagomonas_calceolata.AAC.4
MEGTHGYSEPMQTCICTQGLPRAGLLRSRMIFKVCSAVIILKQGTPISLQDFTGDLRHRLHGVWSDVEGMDSRETNNKLATHQAL